MYAWLHSLKCIFLSNVPLRIGQMLSSALFIFNSQSVLILASLLQSRREMVILMINYTWKRTNLFFFVNKHFISYLVVCPLKHACSNSSRKLCCLFIARVKRFLQSCLSVFRLYLLPVYSGTMKNFMGKERWNHSYLMPVIFSTHLFLWDFALLGSWFQLWWCWRFVIKKLFLPAVLFSQWDGYKNAFILS